MDLAEMLKEHQAKTGESYATMAIRADGLVTGATLWNVARRAHPPQRRTIEAVALIVGVDLSVAMEAAGYRCFRVTDFDPGDPFADLF